MRILAVDDEKLALEALVHAIAEADPENVIYATRFPDEAISLAEKENPDTAFLDITMRGMDGIQLAEELMKRNPEIQIIFTTGYEEYMKEAFRIHASGYVTKPITPEKIREELLVARRRQRGAFWGTDTGTDEMPAPGSGAAPAGKPGLYVRCFGNFQVFLGGESKPLIFPSAKTAELFAYLVDRKGAVCSNAEILAALWEDDDLDERRHVSYFKKIRRELELTLRECGCYDVLLRTWGGLGIMTEKITCDYYEFLKGKGEENPSYAYHGEYMSQYSWAEVTNAALAQEWLESTIRIGKLREINYD